MTPRGDARPQPPRLHFRERNRVLGAVVSDPATLVTLSTLEGWGFVAVTGSTLAVLLCRHVAQRTRHVREIVAHERRFRPR